jgi:hypothetical protein
MEMVDMVITGIRFSGRKSRSVNNFTQRPDLGLQKSARYQKPEENQVQLYGKTKHSGNLVFPSPVHQPGTKVLMSQAHVLNLLQTKSSMVEIKKAGKQFADASIPWQQRATLEHLEKSAIPEKCTDKCSSCNKTAAAECVPLFYQYNVKEGRDCASKAECVDCLECLDSKISCVLRKCESSQPKATEKACIANGGTGMSCFDKQDSYECYKCL